MKPGQSSAEVLRRRLNNSLASSGKFRIERPSGSVLRPRFIDIFDSDFSGFELDPVAISEFLGHYSFFGSRTLLKQVKRTDFFERNDLGSSYQVTNVPRHGRDVVPPDVAAQRFLDLLLKETEGRIKGCRHVGLLLSGGMDSRIVAGALRHLQQTGNCFRVTCFTWGDPKSRDPVYAERIAAHYGWSFEHFQLGPETLWENINTAAANGCFYSAMHLHAMVAVAARACELEVELMLAGSYGDSIGRAEYSRVHVSKLQPIEKRLRNWYGLMSPSLYSNARKETLLEIQRCRTLYGASLQYGIRELDLQLHYMRNMLGSAMSVIDARVPLAQAFTSTELVEFMWSLAPHCRTDDIYFRLLSELDPELLAIPWARTGRPYLSDASQSDGLIGRFHDYPAWTRVLLDRIRKAVFSGAIERAGVFDKAAIGELFSAFQRFEFIRAGRILEVLVWLASLGIFLERADLPTVESPMTTSPVRIRGRIDLGLAIASQYRVFGGKSKPGS